MSRSLPGRRLARAGLATALAGTAVLAAAGPASAYCRIGSQRFSGNSSTIWTLTTVPASFDDEVGASARAWNGKGRWTFTHVARGTYGPYRNPVDYKAFSTMGLPSDVPGVTQVTSYSGSTIYDTRVTMNSQWTWNTSGVMNKADKKADVRTVLTHEFGHVIRLDHPWVCGAMTTAETNAVMNAQFKQKWSVNSDDVAGLQAIYGS